MTELLASLQDYAAFRGVQYDPTDLQAILALESASEAVRQYTGQDFTLTEDDEIRLSGRRKESLVLPEIPVLVVTTVTEDDEELVVEDDYVVGPSGILYRVWPCVWAYGRMNIYVTYTHGYEFVPPDVRETTMEIASRVVTAGGTGGQSIKAETVGAYSISYETGSGTAVSVGLTASDRVTLDPYRMLHAR